MRVRLNVRHTDLLSGETRILAEGYGLFDGRVLRYRESPPFEGSDRLELRGDGADLFHEGETESRTHLYLGRSGTAEAITPFGSMCFETELIEYKNTGTEMILAYRVKQAGETVSSFRLEYRMEALETDIPDKVSC